MTTTIKCSICGENYEAICWDPKAPKCVPCNNKQTRRQLVEQLLEIFSTMDKDRLQKWVESPLPVMAHKCRKIVRRRKINRF